MAHGPKALALELTSVERAALAKLIRHRKVGQALAKRARVVLARAEPGATNLGVARALGVSRPTVALWRQRFALHGWRVWSMRRVLARQGGSMIKRSSV